jgi:hypothetical protein
MIQKGFKKKENIFRQIAEEKPYLVFGFNQKRFYKEARNILGGKVTYTHVRDWLMGYRRRHKKVKKRQ